MTEQPADAMSSDVDAPRPARARPRRRRTCRSAPGRTGRGLVPLTSLRRARDSAAPMVVEPVVMTALAIATGFDGRMVRRLTLRSVPVGPHRSGVR